ncbi:uncharacterized protein N7479_004815 [Penicillium vulpinum]|uniref:uncharacterized protein n=1 Tax=Penicillium vulpinum TaxID=29845 RepID=UPI002547BB5A|nr:uncharacterized protein N7479_004815 [Penicillium vulpinum]KAJ5964939.1 hypothetical protein N7479_004815 [Penicillium vulpinum]
MNNQVLTILAKVVDFMASSETYTLTTRIEEWHKLHDLLEYWNSSVKDKGFMDPVSVLDEGDKFEGAFVVSFRFVASESIADDA